MIAWVYLTSAIVLEVAATLCLRVGSVTGRRSWYLAVAVGYTAAFGLLALTLDAGLGLGVAYGVWAASGVALTALASRVLFGERLTGTMLLGLGLIVLGVLAVQLGSTG